LVDKGDRESGFGKKRAHSLQQTADRKEAKKRAARLAVQA
jgi:hypothetical protein